MTTRYQKSQIEDVARLLNGAIKQAEREQRFVDVLLVEEFADLFAADNPPICRVAARHFAPCGIVCLSGGFDRESFLAACGLEEGQS